MTLNEYAAEAASRLEAVTATTAHLTRLHADPHTEANRREIGATHAAIRTGLKLAEVQALLAIATELREARLTAAAWPPIGFRA